MTLAGSNDCNIFREEIGRFHVELEGRRFPLGLGTAYIGQGADEATRTLFQQTLDEAYAAGVRYYDTAEQAE